MNLIFFDLNYEKFNKENLSPIFKKSQKYYFLSDLKEFFHKSIYKMKNKILITRI